MGYYYAAAWNITLNFTRLLVHIEHRMWKKKSPNS